MQILANALIRLTILHLVFLAAACAPKVGSDRWFNQTSAEEINLFYSAVCQNYGFHKGNQAFAECIQREINEQKQRNVTMKNNPNASGPVFAGTGKAGVTIVLTETFE